MVKHGETGFICDADNPVPDLKRYILELVNNAELRQRQSDNILKLSQTFTIEAMVEKTLNIYQKK